MASAGFSRFLVRSNWDLGAGASSRSCESAQPWASPDVRRDSRRRSAPAKQALTGTQRWDSYPRISSVTEPGGRASPSVLELEPLLLDAKLAVPDLQPGSVSRSALINTARTSDCRVVGITAPAGYGKSTLLAQWAEMEDRRVGWVSLDRFDDDPAALLSVLAAAYARISGNTELIGDVRGVGVSALGRAAPLLASAFRTSPVPFVPMLDDLHELRSPDCHDVLAVVISGLPRGSQLVAASRAEQPHLPRLRASRDAVEFAASDLALDVHGAEQIFARAHINLTGERGRGRDRADRGVAGRALLGRIDRRGHPRSGDDLR